MKRILFALLLSISAYATDTEMDVSIDQTENRRASALNRRNHELSHIIEINQGLARDLAEVVNHTRNVKIMFFTFFLSVNCLVAYHIYTHQMNGELKK